MSILPKSIVMVTIFLAGVVLMPSLVFAADLPSQCPAGTYNNIDVSINGGEGTGGNDFIFVGDGNSTAIDGKGGADCILVGNSNSKDITVGGGNDVVVVGSSNSGQIRGQGGADIIVVGNNNTADIISGGGTDSITVGNNNTGQIKTEGGDDNIAVGCGHSGTIDSGGGTDTEKTSCLPVVSPSAGTYTSIQKVSLTSEAGASIYYTLDGTTPACSPATGTLYSSSVSVFSTKTIKSISCSPKSLVSDVASSTYTIERVETNASDLSSLVSANFFVPTTSASAVTLAQNLKLNVSADSGTSQVVIAKDTSITRSDGQTLNTSQLTSSQANTNTLAGLTAGKVFEGALQWGIPNTTLQFSPAITISIFVGTDLNGQTLDVVRSVNGTESWTNEGIVSPGTCTVANGICSIQATKASYYAATATTPASNNSSGGGSCVGCIVMIDGIPVSNNTQPVQTIEESIVKEAVEEIIEQEVQATPAPSATPQPTPVVQKVALSKPVVKVAAKPSQIENEIEIKKPEVDPVAQTPQAKEGKSFIVSLFASIGKLMFFGFDIFR